MMNPNRQSLCCSWALPVAFSLETHAGHETPDPDEVPQIQRIIRLDCMSDPRLPYARFDGQPIRAQSGFTIDYPNPLSTGDFSLIRLRRRAKLLRAGEGFTRSSLNPGNGNGHMEDDENDRDTVRIVVEQFACVGNGRAGCRRGR